MLCELGAHVSIPDKSGMSPLGFGVEVLLGFRVKGLAFGVEGLGFRTDPNRLTKTPQINIYVTVVQTVAVIST